MEYLIPFRGIFYILGGLILCIILRYGLKGFGENSCEELSAHFSIITTLVVPILTMVFQRFDITFAAASVWGFVALICHIYIALHLHHREILSPILKSKLAYLFLKVGVGVEMTIFREGLGCLLIALFITLGCVLYTIGVISGSYRLLPIIILLLYLSLRKIASWDGLVYTQALDPSNEIGSQIRLMDKDDRPFLFLLPISCLLNVILICIIGSLQRETTADGLFKTGCYKLQSLFIKQSL